MAERVDVVVRERGAKQVRRNIEDIGKGAQTTDKALGILRSALLTLGAGLAARQIIQTADAFTTLQNRLRNVTSSTAELTAVQNELFAISNRTRSDVRATTEVYTRTALATKDLGKSQRETLQFTESLNQAVILSGASATESTNALIQLSQGLASGALRGDELRSVLEQLPTVADVIAKELGVTRGELRKMGQQGEITAGIIFEAFQNARQELAERFGQTIPTISQSITVLRNNFIQFVGALDSATGATGVLSQAILLVANNLNIAIPIAAAFIGILAAGRIIAAAQQVFALASGFISLAGSLAQATGILQAFTTALTFLATTPIGLLITAVTATVAVLFAFREELRQLGGIGEIVANIIDVASQVFDTFIQVLLEAARALGIVSAEASDMGQTVDLEASRAARSVSQLGSAVSQTANAIKSDFRSITPVMAESFADGANSASGSLETLQRNANQVANSIVSDMARAGSSVTTAGGSVSDVSGGGGGGGSGGRTTGTITSTLALLARRYGPTIAQLTGGTFVGPTTVNPRGEIRGADPQLRQALDLLRSQGYRLDQLTTGIVTEVARAQFGGTQEDLLRRELESRGLIESSATELSSASSSLESASSSLESASKEICNPFQKAQERQNVFGFRGGGSFTVPGTGGPDSQRVVFDATPGERVTVETPGQQRAGDSGGSRGDVYLNVTYNIETPDANSFRRNQTQITAKAVNQLSKVARRM